MKTLIYSMYIHIPDHMIEAEHSDCEITKTKTHETTNKMLENYHWLKSQHEKYAKLCGADYKLFEFDDDYLSFREKFFLDKPHITMYNIINFYKIWLLYQHLDYDRILYIDFDVIPTTEKNVFEELDFDSGILCRVNHEGTYSTKDLESHTIRSPRAKWWNTRELLLDEGFDGENDVYNTGIVGATPKNLDKLSYFKDFKASLEMMHEKATDEMYPQKIKSMLGYDNETLFSYLMQVNDVKLNDIPESWHFVMNHKFSFIPKNTNLVHIINKDFEYAKDYIQRLV